MLLESRASELAPLAPPRSKGPDATPRIEDQYLVKKTFRQELLDLLNARMRPNYPFPGTRYTEVESTYFDSPSLDLYMGHFLSKGIRQNLRTRKYAPNGHWLNDRAHLELKSRDGTSSRRIRLLLGSSEIKAVGTGLPIRLSRTLGRLNPETRLRALEKRLNRMNDLIRQNSLIPTCRVTFQRQSFEQGPLRINVDEQLRSDLVAKQTVAYARARRSKLPGNLLDDARAMLHRFNREDAVILEIRHSGDLPTWFLDFLAKSGAERINFSKYCYSMTRYLLTH